MNPRTRRKRRQRSESEDDVYWMAQYREPGSDHWVAVASCGGTAYATVEEDLQLVRSVFKDCEVRLRKFVAVPDADGHARDRELDKA